MELQYHNVSIRATQSQINFAIARMDMVFVAPSNDRYAESRIKNMENFFYITRDVNDPKIWLVHSFSWTSSLLGASQICRLISKLTEKLYTIDIQGRNYLFTF